MMPHFASPYNCEKRRFNEEQLLEQAAKCAEAANVALPPAYNDMDLILFPEGSLRDANGNVISQRHLIGKSVALYFADGADPKCRSFLPFLLQFYRTVNEGGSHQKVEVIFVSADKNEASFKEHAAHMPWLTVGFHEPLRDVLMRHFCIQKMNEVPTAGQGLRAPLPALVVVGADGREAQFLHVAAGRGEGERALLRWDWRNTRFGADRFLVRRES